MQARFSRICSVTSFASDYFNRLALIIYFITFVTYVVSLNRVLDIKYFLFNLLYNLAVVNFMLIYMPFFKEVLISRLQHLQQFKSIVCICNT